MNKKCSMFISQPYLLKMYNQKIEGVDVCDRIIFSYRPHYNQRGRIYLQSWQQFQDNLSRIQEESCKITD